MAIWEIMVMGTLDGPVVEPPTPAFVDVIPKPASVVETDAGAFQLSGVTPIVANGNAVGTAEMLADTLRTSTGLALPVAATGSKAITLTLDTAAAMPAEGYTLVSGADGVTITAADRHHHHHRDTHGAADDHTHREADGHHVARPRGRVLHPGPAQRQRPQLVDPLRALLPDDPLFHPDLGPGSTR
ncbi:glycoside hydrolase family 20 zincin-like fold domain-containing protein [Tessaracoccus antarcticus]|nr:glycoside hydrolase family 20 zincin-like fold domain-containing protein [Tessaracoccus antarcticus]